MPPDSWRQFKDWHESLIHLRKDHPLQIAARTYVLSLSLSLGPAIIPALASRRLDTKRMQRLISVFQKELSLMSFASSMTLAVAGGAALDYYWEAVHDLGNLDFVPKRVRMALQGALRCAKAILPSKKARTTFSFNVLTALCAVLLMQSGRRSVVTRKASIPLTAPFESPAYTLGRKSPLTLDLSLLLFVRALDAGFRALLFKRADACVNETDDQVKRKRLVREKVHEVSDFVDALLFASASGRIMYCFIYLPHRLPRSYVRWIGAMANVDKRLLDILRKLARGSWSYDNVEGRLELAGYASDLGYPRAWADSLLIPSQGGPSATECWEQIGVKNRANIGGFPCELVHGRVGSSIIAGGIESSCTGNALVRFAIGFLEGLALYTPVHFIPVLLSQPRTLLSLSTLRTHFLALCQSSAFLGAFISAFYSAVCFTRTAVLARLFPHVSHNFWDGPLGCIMAGCLICGWSIFIEQKKRRGEMALYVLPRALRTLVKDSWLRSGSKTVKVLERLMFAISLASILTFSRYQPDSLRGLSRGTVSFVMRGLKSRPQGHDEK